MQKEEYAMISFTFLFNFCDIKFFNLRDFLCLYFYLDYIKSVTFLFMLFLPIYWNILDNLSKAYFP